MSVRRPYWRYVGDGECVSLVSTRVPPEQLQEEAVAAFWLRYGRRVVRVFRADLLPDLAGSLSCHGLHTLGPVDQTRPLRRWLLWWTPEGDQNARDALRSDFSRS